MQTIRTTIMLGAVAIVAAPSLAFAACGGHQSAESDKGMTVATQEAPQTSPPTQSSKPDDQQAMRDRSESSEPAQDE